jgi:hypothetical protein
MKADMGTEDLENSGVYEDLDSFIGQYKSYYDDLKTYQDEMSKYGFIDVKNNMKTGLTDISNVTEYNAWMKEYEKQVKARAKSKGQNVDEVWKEA